MSVKNLTRIILSGGFHNANPIKMFVDPRFLQTRQDGFLSDRQIKRLERHFCGHPDCTCGSFRRAKMETWVCNVKE
jgi:hypothetical protein